MALPTYTRTGQLLRKQWLQLQIKEIENCDPSVFPDWLPMYKEMLYYVFLLEERITQLEERSS